MDETSVRHSGFRLAVVVSLFALWVPACAGTTPEGDGKSTTPPTTIDPDGFDPVDFTDPATIDNRWFPLTPGTQWVWEGRAFDGAEVIERRVVFTVSDLTKLVDGVETVVTWDLDYNDGELEEADIALLAQDDAGNVWLLGEYPEEYEEGEIVKTPTWIHGSQGAKAGILIMANPQLGTPDYAQGWGPKVGWNDRAETYAVGERNCVPVGCYEDVLVIREFNPDEPGAYQVKYYAPGVGGIRVGWAGKNEVEREILLLVEFRRLTSEELATVREEVLAQDQRAYEYAAGAYGQTSPAMLSSG
jgi:hypothetical protein